MMLPILISVSLAPGSYFFCAFADVAIAAADTSDTKAKRLVRRSSMLSSRLFFAECGKPCAGWQGRPYSARRNGLLRAVRCGEYAPISPPDPVEANRLEAQNLRVGPRYPRLGAACFRFARWLARKTMSRAGFHELGSDFAKARIEHVRR